MFKTATLAAAVCTAALFSAPAAFAKDVTVSYSDLDLTTVAGQKTLKTRLLSAARKACDYNTSTVTGTMLPSASARACYNQANAKVKEQMASAIDAAGSTQLGG